VFPRPRERLLLLPQGATAASLRDGALLFAWSTTDTFNADSPLDVTACAHRPPLLPDFFYFPVLIAILPGTRTFPSLPPSPVGVVYKPDGRLFRPTPYAFYVLLLRGRALRSEIDRFVFSVPVTRLIAHVTPFDSGALDPR